MKRVARKGEKEGVGSKGSRKGREKREKREEGVYTGIIPLSSYQFEVKPNRKGNLSVITPLVY